MKGNSPLEVMAAIVANGGPVLAWVGREGSKLRPDTVTGVDLDDDTPLKFGTNDDWYSCCSLTDPHPQYKPIPTEWKHDWAKCRAMDADGRLWEYENNLEDMDLRGHCWYRKTNSERKAFCVSVDNDPTNWQNSLEQRPRKMRHMTPLEAFEFLAEGHDGKPRVWQGSDMNPGLWLCSDAWDWSCLPEFAKYSNLSDRDGDTLIWRKFPLVEDKAWNVSVLLYKK